MTEVSDWDSESLLNSLLDCLPVYLSDGIDEPEDELKIVDEKTALICTPILLEELLTRHEKCHSDLYCTILNLPRGSTYARIASFLKNSNSAHVCFVVNIIGMLRAYERMQQIDVSELSFEQKKKYFQNLENQRQEIQAILEAAGTEVID